MTTVRSVTESIAAFWCGYDGGLTCDRGNEAIVSEKGSGRKIGQNASLLHGDDPARIPAHKFHVVLDEDDGADPRCLCCVYQNSHDAMLVRCADTAGWLIQENKLRLQREGA